MADRSRWIRFRRWWWRTLTPRGRWVVSLSAIALCALVGWLSFGRGWRPRLTVSSPHSVIPLALSADGKLLATKGTDGVTIWNAETGNVRTVLHVSGGRSAMMGAFSKNGQVFAALTSGGHPSPIYIDVIDILTGKVQASIQTLHQSALQVDFENRDPYDRSAREVRAIVCTQDTRTGNRYVIDARSGHVVANSSFTPPKAGEPVAVSANGQNMVTSTFGGSKVFVRSLLADFEVGRLDILTPGGVSSLGISPEGMTVAVGVSEGRVELWRLGAKREPKELDLHSVGYQAFGTTFSPNGRVLASRGQFLRPSTPIGTLGMVFRQFLPAPYRRPPPQIVVAEVATGRIIGTLPGSAHAFFSADGRSLAKMNSDFSTSVYDVPQTMPP